MLVLWKSINIVVVLSMLYFHPPPPSTLALPCYERLLFISPLLVGGGNSNIFGIFTPNWGRFPFWLIFFKWVETTNKHGLLVLLVILSLAKNHGGFWFSTLLPWPLDTTFIRSTLCVTWISGRICFQKTNRTWESSGDEGHGKSKWDHPVLFLFYCFFWGWVGKFLGFVWVLFGVGGCIWWVLGCPIFLIQVWRKGFGSLYCFSSWASSLIWALMHLQWRAMSMLFSCVLMGLRLYSDHSFFGLATRTFHKVTS